MLINSSAVFIANPFAVCALVSFSCDISVSVFSVIEAYGLNEGEGFSGGMRDLGA